MRNVNIQVLNTKTTQGNPSVLDQDLIPGHRPDHQREMLNLDPEIVENLPKKHGVTKHQKADLDQHPVVEAFQDPVPILPGRSLYLDHLQGLDHGVVDGQNLGQDPGPDPFPDPDQGQTQDRTQGQDCVRIPVQDRFLDLLIEKGELRRKRKRGKIRGPDQENRQQKANEAVLVGDAVGHRLTHRAHRARHLHVLSHSLLARVLAAVLILGKYEFCASGFVEQLITSPYSAYHVESPGQLFPLCGS